MSRAVLISIKPEWCEMIALGAKTIEVRKTRPKLDPSFKCYIYCTTTGDCCYKSNNDGKIRITKNTLSRVKALSRTHQTFLNGKVIGEFMCDNIVKFPYNRDGYGLKDEADIIARSCVPEKELYHYLQGATPYGWHISNLVIYDKPRELSEFSKPCICEDEYEGGTYCDCLHCDLAGDSDDGVVACNRKLTRPPQSWCYVEDIT